MQSSRLVPDNNNITIKQWTKGLGRKWPGGIVWAAVFRPPLFTMFLLLKKRAVWGLLRWFRTMPLARIILW
jgi:hypothetical protein